jgi:DNA-binding transcriptional regulator YiaG
MTEASISNLIDKAKERYVSDLSAIIELVRKRDDVTHREMAESMGVSVGSVYAWKSGRSDLSIEKRLVLGLLFRGQLIIETFTDDNLPDAHRSVRLRLATDDEIEKWVEVLEGVSRVSRDTAGMGFGSVESPWGKWENIERLFDGNGMGLFVFGRRVG